MTSLTDKVSTLLKPAGIKINCDYPPFFHGPDLPGPVVTYPTGLTHYSKIDETNIACLDNPDGMPE